MVDVMVGLSPQAKAQGDLEKKLSALNALVELVDGPPAGEQPRVISDPAMWVHTAFYTYRSALADNDPLLPRLARIEHDFIAAMMALNFGDQKRQLRKALRALQTFEVI